MNRIPTWCGALALLFVPACGGDDSAPKQTPSNTSTSTPKAAPGKQGSARKKPARPVRVDMIAAKALWGMEPPSPKVDNPSTPEKLALGRMLFHEKHLSADGSVSCASCHDLANYGQDNAKIAAGATRNTPSVWNASRQFAQFWDYRVETVEQVPLEHGLGTAAEVVSRIKEKPELVAAFGAAFPGDDPITGENLGLALGAFQRTLVTKSRFDAFLDGDSGALTNEEKLGLNTFLEVGCQTCHMSRLVGGSMLQKVGVFRPYPDAEDTGRHAVTGKETDKFMFKVPSLLNVTKTAPYNHDGGVATLEKAVAQMAEIQLQKQLTDDQVEAIVAFLGSLTGELPAGLADQK